ncbi:BgTH12-03969 [Blumeria graminis f. sp. triticale]|uniref:BgTH12-03969 n=1 Tax=Blumeria graminis f. sp. triticale TaxID=1689686 RepID=A0A9W4CW53_BLUGR|nr:BgTH12-03969 [Blumeria graminis f. sp. triticale]
MIINQSIAVLCSNIVLVPYERKHVAVYHEWMKSEEIRQSTASERLTLAEEYDMQKNWRTDADKLTFIICTVPHRYTEDIRTGVFASSEFMVGDVNLFISAADEITNNFIGELEVMIAPLEARRNGYARTALLGFLRYVSNHTDEILAEYRGQNSEENHLSLKVKIGSENQKSIKLFESIGFCKTRSDPDYFGEYEFRFADFSGRRVSSLMDQYRIQDYLEFPYREVSDLD